MKRKIILLLIPALILAAVLLYAYPMLQTASGYSAKMICSCLYVEQSPMSVAELQEQRLNFSLLPQVSLEHDATEQRVSASIFGIADRYARFIEGRGCVLRSDDNMDWPRPIATPATPLSQVASDLPLRPDSTSLLGVDTAQLNAAMSFGMEAVEGGAAHAIVLLRDGKLIAERYAPGITPDSRLLGWSMTKSVTGALVGIRIGDNMLSLDRQPVFPQWATDPDRPDPRHEITLEGLLRMNSGLEWEEAYGTVTDATVMLYDQPNMSAYARKQPVAFREGEEWNYSSGTTNLLMDLVLSTFPDQPSAHRWMYESLFHPIGANSFLIETDQSGRQVGSSYGWARARDWAKLGHLFLMKGRWGDRQLFPEEWVDYLRVPAKGSNDTYGGQIWLKGPTTPALPDDAYAFQGFQDQRVYMIPSHRLVLVRLGHNADKSTDFNELIKRILQAVPAI